MNFRCIDDSPAFFLQGLMYKYIVKRKQKFSREVKPD